MTRPLQSGWWWRGPLLPPVFAGASFSSPREAGLALGRVSDPTDHRAFFGPLCLKEEERSCRESFSWFEKKHMSSFTFQNTDVSLNITRPANSQSENSPARVRCPFEGQALLCSLSPRDRTGGLPSRHSGSCDPGPAVSLRVFRPACFFQPRAVVFHVQILSSFS